MDKVQTIPFGRSKMRAKKSKMPPLSGVTEKVIQNKFDLTMYLIAFFSARVSILGELLPFGYAYFIAATQRKASRAIPVGVVILTGIYTIQGRQAVPFLAAMLAFISVQALFRKKLHKNLSIYINGLFMLLLCRGISLYLTGGVSYDYFLLGIETVIAGGMIFTFAKGLNGLNKQVRYRGLTRDEGVCILLMACLAFTGVMEVSLFGLSMKKILYQAAIMSIAFAGGAGIGAIGGVVMAAMSGIASFISPSLIGAYGLSGMLGGTFREFRRIGTATGFILGNMIVAFFTAQLDAGMLILGENIIAFLLFLAIPKKMIETVRSFIPSVVYHGGVGNINEKKIRETASKQLQGFSNIFHELGVMLEQVAPTVEEKRDKLHLEYLLKVIARRICQNCYRYKGCWERDFYRTSQNMINLLVYAEEGKDLAPADVERELQGGCTKHRDMAIVVNHLLDDYKTNFYWQKKLGESRELVSVQLKGVAEIIGGLVEEMKIESNAREDMADRIYEELLRNKITVHDIQINDLGKEMPEITVVKSPCKGVGECGSKVLNVIEGQMNRRLEIAHKECGYNSEKNQCILQILPPLQLDVESHLSQFYWNEDGISGDSGSILQLDEGKFMMVLSDGMGIGPKAASESRNSITLFEHLVKNGFKQNMALQTVNSALILRSQGERFATFDLVSVDLFTGDAEFIKVGASTTYVKRGGNISTVKSSTLPLGVVKGLEMPVEKKKLRAGDLIIMVTDGVLDASENSGEDDSWLVEFLAQTKTEEPKKLAQEILRKAKEKAKNQYQDDMTVLVGRIDRRF